MGQVKNYTEESQADADLKGFLKELLNQEAFSGALLGIAKQVVGKGLDSLSSRQREIIDNYVINYEKAHQCPRCSNGNVSSLNDLIFIAENELCPMCDNDREKFMKD